MRSITVTKRDAIGVLAALLVSVVSAAEEDGRVLNAADPVAHELVIQLVRERALALTAEARREALLSDEYRARYPEALAASCARPENARLLACAERHERTR